MSQSREDYIKFIYEARTEEPLANKIISQGLGVSPASVTEMIDRLAQEDLVERIPYHGVLLTPQGEEMGRDLVRKHEIWEFFLESRLGYTAEEVHVMAELLEHVTTTDLSDRLAKYIDFPEDKNNGA